jgi:hypothetical protein
MNLLGGRNHPETRGAEQTVDPAIRFGERQ